MTDRLARMLEDKYLRDSARALVEADIEHLKTDVSQKSLATRAMERAREGAAELYEEAIDIADDNKGALAALLAAVVKVGVGQLYGFGRSHLIVGLSHTHDRLLSLFFIVSINFLSLFARLRRALNWLLAGSA